MPRLPRQFLIDPASRSAACVDFGNIVCQRPDAVAQARSADDVSTAMRFCQDHRIPVAMRGQGHSTNGQALACNGLVIDSRSMNAVHSLEPGRIVVEPGARWQDVLDATLPRGLTPPVLTDYLGLSVGGTLSVGGLGGTSGWFGCQADNVLEIDVVLANAQLRTCSPGRDSELFDAVLCGLGQCGIIVRATLRLRPAPLNVRRYKLYYRELADLMADQCRLLREDRFDYLEGQLCPTSSGHWKYLLEAGTFLGPRPGAEGPELLSDLRHTRHLSEITLLPYGDFLRRLEPSVARLMLTGEWQYAHPWLNLLLPCARAHEFVENALRTLQPDDIGASGVVLLYPLRKSRLKRPLLRVPEGPVAFLFALLRAAVPGSPQIEQQIAGNRALYDYAKSLGATVYPVGTVPLTQGDWKTHFGERWPTLCALKHHYDPYSLLTPGQGIFARVSEGQPDRWSL